MLKKDMQAHMVRRLDTLLKDIEVARDTDADAYLANRMARFDEVNRLVKEMF